MVQASYGRKVGEDSDDAHCNGQYHSSVEAATHALACDPARHCGHSSDNHAFGTLHEPDLALDAKALGTCPHMSLPGKN